ncbi:MAG: DUF4351 domain-containing protein [Leptolyngbyaceae cyanobacterium SL_5_9]|nr:DUF4351 domain-containing protein [Leptolyngbyaceae cyanobacterium SL_5_9]NJO73476.1 DUF4351 domain-containing protein [Leptolyngbyaceae cyanobacterium RM1_406_9]
MRAASVPSLLPRCSSLWATLILRLLKRRVGEVPEPLKNQIEALPIDQLEALGEDLPNFANMTDLER